MTFEEALATTVLQIRMDEDLKNEAADLFDKMGMDLPTAIRVFLKRAVAEKAIPFEVRDPAQFLPQIRALKLCALCSTRLLLTEWPG